MDRQCGLPSCINDASQGFIRIHLTQELGTTGWLCCAYPTVISRLELEFVIFPRSAFPISWRWTWVPAKCSCWKVKWCQALLPWCRVQDRHQLRLLPATVRHIEESIKYVRHSHHNACNIPKLTSRNWEVEINLFSRSIRFFITVAGLDWAVTYIQWTWPLNF